MIPKKCFKMSDICGWTALRVYKWSIYRFLQS